jgi:hypothetical protein
MANYRSATQGGGGISPTFGAGLWVMDYVFQLLQIGVKVTGEQITISGKLVN